MNKFILVLLWLGSGTWLIGQNPTVAKSKISAVTVYLSGAQVTRTTEVRLEKGDNEVLFQGLAPDILANSIQASAPAAVLINSVSKETNYLRPQEDSPRVSAIRDSLKLIQQQQEDLDNELGTIATERGMIMKNQSLSGQETGVNVAELQAMASFFRVRLTELAAMEQKRKTKKKKLNEIKTRLNKQLTALRAEKNRPSNDILVKVRANAATRVKMVLSYIVPQASWKPSYDLRATDTNSPVELTYRGEVFQNTGIDWTDIDLTLSSTNPNLSGNRPELAQWNLYLRNPRAYAQTRGGLYKSADQYQAKEMDKSYYSAGEVTERTLADYTTVVEGITSAEFQIEIKQRIPSDGQYHQVSIQKDNLPATYQHSSVPKLDPTAYLLARITNWEELNLLPGAVNVFFEGTYIAESFIDPNYTQDTIDFSLGRDPKVVIERKQLKDYSKVRTLGTNRERTFAYEITVRNTKKNAVSLVMYDQVPVSQDEDITVKIEEKSGARHDEETGELAWTLDLAPAETKTLQLIFSVKHPKKKTVPGI